MVAMNRDNRITLTYFFIASILSFLIEAAIKNSSMLKLNDNFIGVVFTLLVYTVLWIIPVFIIVKIDNRESLFRVLKLKCNALKGISTGLLYSFLIVGFYFIKLILTGKMNLKPSISSYIWISGLLVGLLEEIPFRGFILNRLKNNINFWKANIITSILFALAHIPNWNMQISVILISLYSTFVISLFLGYIFNKTDSLWTTIIIHSVYNLCFFILV